MQKATASRGGTQAETEENYGDEKERRKEAFFIRLSFSCWEI